jgi:hypothetical protein
VAARTPTPTLAPEAGRRRGPPASAPRASALFLVEDSCSRKVDKTMAGLLVVPAVFSLAGIPFPEIRPGMPRCAAAISLLLLSCAAQVAA